MLHQFERKQKNDSYLHLFYVRIIVLTDYLSTFFYDLQHITIRNIIVNWEALGYLSLFPSRAHTEATRMWS